MTNTEYLLICLTEEAAEVQQAVAKCLRFGLDGHHQDRPDTTNAEELQQELVDLDAVRYLLIEAGVLPHLHSTIKDMRPKIDKVRGYMEEARQDYLLALSELRRAQPATYRFADCHIWEPGDKLDTISDKCEVLIKAADIKALIQPDNEPLTLDALRGMADLRDAIWDSCLNCWCVIKSGVIAYFGGGWRQFEENRFYRRKPDPEGGEG